MVSLVLEDKKVKRKRMDRTIIPLGGTVKGLM
jgi:hypothetical protein